MEIDYLHGMLWTFLNAKGFLGRGIELEKRVDEGGVLVRISVFPGTADGGPTKDSEADVRFRKLIKALQPPKAVEVRSAKTKSDFDSMVERLNFHVIPTSAVSTDPFDSIASYDPAASPQKGQDTRNTNGNATDMEATSSLLLDLSSDAACQADFQSFAYGGDDNEIDIDDVYNTVLKALKLIMRIVVNSTVNEMETKIGVVRDNVKTVKDVVKEVQTEIGRINSKIDLLLDQQGNFSSVVSDHFILHP